jgi:hypothetical protein
MPASMDDVDRFQNSLTEVLGADTLAILSSAEEDRPFLGFEALGAFAVYLLMLFATAFAEELKKRIGDEVKAVGKRLADAVVDRLKAAASAMKPLDAGSAENQKKAVGTADTSLRELAAYPAAKASLEAAANAGKAKVVAELKGRGFSDKEAGAKADKFVETIMSRVPK